MDYHNLTPMLPLMKTIQAGKTTAWNYIIVLIKFSVKQHIFTNQTADQTKPNILIP